MGARLQPRPLCRSRSPRLVARRDAEAWLDTIERSLLEMPRDILKDLLDEMVENDRLQQDGKTWTVPGRPTHQEQVVA